MRPAEMAAIVVHCDENGKLVQQEEHFYHVEP